MDSDNLELGNIIVETGDFGKFQRLMLLYQSLAFGILAWSLLAMTFGGAVPQWKCSYDPINGMLNATTNHSSEVESACGNVSGTSCETFEFATDMKTIVSEWNLVCGKRMIPGSITTILMSGLLVGIFIWGHVSDRFGRRPSLFINLLCITVLHAITAVSVSWRMMATIMFFIGFSVGGFFCSGILFEYVSIKWRMYIYLLPVWSIWSALLPLYFWLVPNWRYLHTAVAVLGALLLPPIWIIPESFRWLVSRGHMDKAENTIQRIARINGKPAPSMERVRQLMEWEMLRRSKEIYTAMDLFKTKFLARTTVLFSFIGICNAYSFYSLMFGVQQLSGSIYVNILLLSIVDIPGVLAVLIGNRCVFGLIVGIMRLADATVSTSLINGFAMTAKFFVGTAWMLCGLWSMECYPTIIRNTGLGFVNSVARIGGMVAPQVVAFSQDIPGLLFLVVGVAMLGSGLACAFLSETKGKDLTDVLPQKRYSSVRIKESDITGISLKQALA